MNPIDIQDYVYKAAIDYVNDIYDRTGFRYNLYDMYRMMVEELYYMEYKEFEKKHCIPFEIEE